MQRRRRGVKTPRSTSRKDIRHSVEGRLLHPLPPKPPSDPGHIQTPPRSTRNRTCRPRQVSPIRLDRKNDNTSPNLDSAVANSNGVVAKSPAPIESPIREVNDKIEHTPHTADKVAHSSLMQPTQTTDPRLRRTADPTHETLHSASFKVSHSQNNTFEGTGILVNLLESIQERIAQDYQRQYEMHQRTFAEYRKDNERRRDDSEKRCEDIQEKYTKSEKRRGEEKGRWEAERKELVKRVNHYKMLIAADLNGRKSLAAQWETEKHALTQQLKSSYVERNLIVNRLEEEKSNWEVECERLSKIAESSLKDGEMATEQLGLERDNFAAVCANHEQERKQWIHEKAIMIARLRDERTAREGLVAALRLRGDALREDSDIGKLGGDERDRKRMRIG